MTELDLIDRYIEADLYDRGVAEARVRPQHVSVWAVIGHFLGTGRSIHRVATDYGLPDEAVAAAVAYYEQHRRDIDARLAANTASDLRRRD